MVGRKKVFLGIAFIVIQSVVMLNVVMLSVAAPLNLVMQKRFLKAFLPKNRRTMGCFVK
jgi:hypothetical protein